MSIDKFTTIKTPCVPIAIENVDTDQIIPARFLKATERKGFGDNQTTRFYSAHAERQNQVLQSGCRHGAGGDGSGDCAGW